MGKERVIEIPEGGDLCLDEIIKEQENAGNHANLVEVGNITMITLSNTFLLRFKSGDSVEVYGEPLSEHWGHSGTPPRSTNNRLIDGRYKRVYSAVDLDGLRRELETAKSLSEQRTVHITPLT